MSTLYQMLGLSPRANEQQIKFAYRALAKQFHPDVNAGDAASAQRFKEAAAAYETLGDPEARAAYDRALACRRVATRRRNWTCAATAAVSFVLTTGSLSLAMWWSRHAAAPQSEVQRAPGMENSPDPLAQHAAVSQSGLPRAPGMENSPDPLAQHAAVSQLELPRAPGMEDSPDPLAQHAAAPQSEVQRAPGMEDSPDPLAQHAAVSQSGLPRAPGMENPADALAQGAHRGEGQMASPLGGTTLGALPKNRRRASNWTTHQDARFGFALKYPADIFVLDTGPADDNVRTFLSQDGQALLRIFAAEISAGTTLAEYRRSLIEERYAGVVLGRTPQRRFWFVLSGTRGEMMLYERVTFSCDGRSVHGWQMIYPLSERTFYDRIADGVHRNYSHGNSPDAHCGEARRRMSQS